jgi:hypothetical protein
MKRISRDHPKFDLMRLLDRYARAKRVSLRDQSNHANFLADLTKHFHANRDNEILIHGLRIQAMFAFMAAALGNCLAIKEEDAGDLYAADSELRAPDFRIVTADGHEILVEVKNHRPSDPTADFVFDSAYFESLRRYGEVFQRALFIAIYWSQWKLWSLVRHDRFDAAGDSYRLSLGEAMKRSEMKLLGDCMLGTVPPLTLRLFWDPRKPRHVGLDGKAEFTIGSVELWAGGEVIDDPLERRIAWFLLQYGKWPVADSPVEIAEGELISIGFEARPEERANPDQSFEMVGTMSQMVSRQYNEITAGSGRVDLLVPNNDPGQLGVLIPNDFKEKNSISGASISLRRFSCRLRNRSLPLLHAGVGHTGAPERRAHRGSGEKLGEGDDERRRANSSAAAFEASPPISLWSSARTAAISSLSSVRRAAISSFSSIRRDVVSARAPSTSSRVASRADGPRVAFSTASEMASAC